jgi:hypothetical protein
MTEEGAWLPYVTLDERYELEAEIELRRKLNAQHRFSAEIYSDSPIAFDVSDLDPMRPPRVAVKLVGLLKAIEGILFTSNLLFCLFFE